MTVRGNPRRPAPAALAAALCLALAWAATPVGIGAALADDEAAGTSRESATERRAVRPVTEPTARTGRAVGSDAATQRLQQAPVRSKVLQQLVGAEDLAAATRRFEDIVAEAPTVQARAELFTTWGDTLYRTARTASDDPELLARAADAYRAALPDLQGTARLAGYNNYASVLLRQQHPDAALDALESIDRDVAREGRVTQARYFYNVGRALEGTGRPREAVERYRRAAQTDRGYLPAARAVIRVLLDGDPEPWRIKALADWARSLLRRGDADIAADGLRRAMGQQAWIGRDGFERVLHAAVLNLTAAPPDPAVFPKAWGAALERVAARGKAPANELAREAIAVWTAAIPPDFSIEFEPSEGKQLVRSLIRSWGPGEASSYLKAAGDSFFSAGGISRALSRYAAAWSVHNANIEAALAAAGLLLDAGERIDPDGDLLDRFIFALFEAKGRAYLGEDWQAILRFHTVLGNIFERLEQWGPRGDPRSALFQWEYALRAHERLKTAAGKPPVPVLRAKFARALQETDRAPEAVAVYLDAVEDALALDNTRLAATYLDSAKSVARGTDLGGERLRTLERRIR